jgi:hypothetical protein
LDLTTANAFAAPVGVDLSPYQDGKHILALYQATKTAWAWISATAPGGETLSGSELVTNGDMELDASWTGMGTAPATNVRSNEQAHGGTYSRKIITDANNEGIGSVAFITTAGALYKSNSWVYTAQNIVRLAFLKGDASGYISENVVPTASTWTQFVRYYTEATGGSGARMGWQNYGNTVGTWYFDDASFQRVTDCSSTGALLLSTKGGSRGWVSNNGIDPNGPMTYRIYRARG